MSSACLPYAKWVHTIARVFEHASMPLYLVGGAVRNRTMGLPIMDVDVCGPALPQEVYKICEGTGVCAYIRAPQFGTVELYAQDDQGHRHMAEYTTFRRDVYQGGHRPQEVYFTSQLQEDAKRRDFSVNALYQRITATDVEPIVDPTGGLQHLRQGVLHTVTEDPEEVLANDGLRILRAARFQAQLGLLPTFAVVQSGKRHSSLLGEIARERMREELSKILLANETYPKLMRVAPAVQGGLESLREMGAWTHLFPELSYQPKTALALDALCVPEGIEPVLGKLALLFWSEASQNLRKALLNLRFSSAETEQVVTLSESMRSLLRQELSLFDAVVVGKKVIQFACNAFESLRCPRVGRYADDQAVNPFLQDNEKDDIEAAKKSAKVYLEQINSEKIPLTLEELAVSGVDLKLLCERAGRPPRCIGQGLRHMWRAAVLGRVPNEHEALLQMAWRWLQVEKNEADDAGKEDRIF